MNWIYWLILFLIVYDIFTSKYAKEVGYFKYAMTYLLSFLVIAFALFLISLIIE